VQTAAARLLEGLGVPRRALPAAVDPDGAGGGGGGGAEVLIRREIRQDGGMLRSRCFVNGAATSLRVLRELAAELVDVNGQHSAQSLRCQLLHASGSGSGCFTCMLSSEWSVAGMSRQDGTDHWHMVWQYRIGEVLFPFCAGTATCSWRCWTASLGRRPPPQT
jgi:hypothetical protein